MMEGLSESKKGDCLDLTRIKSDEEKHCLLAIGTQREMRGNKEEMDGVKWSG